MSGEETFSKITTGIYHTCGLTTDRLVYCWDSGSNGVLANGVNGGNVLAPRQIEAWWD